jgi:glutamyl-tRNA reductase
LIVSTCNRVEVLTATNDAREPAGINRIADFLSQSRQIPHSDFHLHLYNYTDEAVRHLFRVASSLDSMVVGEPQVLGWRAALTRRPSKPELPGAS